MMTSSEKAAELLEIGGNILNKVREYLDLKISEETESLVDAPQELFSQLQGRIKALRDFKEDLSPMPERQKSKNPY